MTSHPRAALTSMIVFASFTALADAQILRGGDLVATQFSPAALFRVTPSGVVSQINAGPFSGPSGIAVTLDREVLVLDYNLNRLVRVDAAGNPTTVASNLQGPIRVTVDHDGTYLVTSLGMKALLRITPQGAVTVIHQGAPFNRPFGIAVDLDGSYLIADDGNDALYHVTPAGAVTTIHQGLPFQLPQGVALFHDGDYAVMDGLADSVFRVPRGGGAVSTLVASPPLGNPCGIVTDHQGGFYVSESSSISNRVVHVLSDGSLDVIASGAPFINLEGAALVPFVSGPTSVDTGPGAQYSLDVDIPSRAGNLYAFYASSSVYPGFTMSGFDVRGVSLNPDALFFLTIFQNAPPFLANWTGLLDASGGATVGIDLSILPAGALSGVTFYVQAMTFGPGFGSGIGEITNPLVLRFP